MGVKLGNLLSKQQISFDDLKDKKIAVDMSNTLYQFLTSIRQRDGTLLMDNEGRVTSHLVGIWSRFSNLMLRGIKLVVVFDGKAPSLKVSTQEEREHRKRIAEDKLEKAKEEDDVEAMGKYSKQTVRMSSEIVNESKELLKAMGLPVIQAPSEADAQMAFMAEQKKVDYVASSDADILLYGAPKVITNLTLSQRRKLPGGATVKTTPEVVELSKVLNELGIDRDKLIALSILVGTDYNKGVFRVGPKTALKLVKQESDFNKLFKEVKAEFDWKKIYAIFKSMPVMKEYQLKWDKIDEDKIKELLIEKHDFGEERVQNTLEKLRKKDKSKDQKGLGDFI
ncbi:MAG: flap endonuclease-1 [Nanoarchaeota archaeon]|nr:flap endonuclease-1 [Nanoarchaeota archaeon]